MDTSDLSREKLLEIFTPEEIAQRLQVVEHRKAVEQAERNVQSFRDQIANLQSQLSEEENRLNALPRG